MAGPVYKATWGRIFALVYDTAFILAERRGFRDVRKELVGLSKGRVVELGTHDELMALGGRYRTMFELQASRFGETAADIEEGVALDEPA